MALLALGSRSDLPAHALVLFTPPCDYEHAPPFMERYRTGRMNAADAIDETTGLVPESAVRAMFRFLAPTSDLVQYVTLWEHLWREDYVEAHRAVNHWAWNHRAMAGPAFLQMVTDYVQENRLAKGTAELGGRPVRLDTVTAPTLLVVARARRVRAASELRAARQPPRIRRHRGPSSAGRTRRRAHGVCCPPLDPSRCGRLVAASLGGN